MKCSVVTGTAKDRVFFVPMYLNRGCCGCPRSRLLPLAVVALKADDGGNDDDDNDNGDGDDDDAAVRRRGLQSRVDPQMARHEGWSRGRHEDTKITAAEKLTAAVRPKS